MVNNNIEFILKRKLNIMFEACFSVLGDGVRVGGNVQFFSFFTGLYIRCNILENF